MTIRQAQEDLARQLQYIYGESEAVSIAERVMEHITGRRRSERITQTAPPLNGLQQQQLEAIAGKLIQATPLQYILNECWFADMKLYVDERVLIPRPETEELVAWIAADAKTQAGRTRTVVDIGTGSGCIAIALKKKLPHLSVRATDESEGALNVAVKNAMIQAVQVYFIRNDFLDESTWSNFGKFDIIVSNPPYIRLAEACTMHRNVLEFEPHQALFVPDDDALLFYRKIAAFAKDHLEDGGSIYLEINEALGAEALALFPPPLYKTELRKDMQGKDRMIKATKV